MFINKSTLSEMQLKAGVKHALSFWATVSDNNILILFRKNFFFFSKDNVNV